MKKTKVAKPTIHSRCRALNAVIREGCIVQANIYGTMRTLISIKSEPDTVSLLFHSDEGLALLNVSADAILEFTVRIPRESAAQ